MDNAAAPAPSVDVLARLNARISLLRSWISHHHHDEPYWWARQTTAPRAQADRHRLRWYADLLHVERATRRKRIHGTHFESIEAQRAYVDQHASVLARMLAGELP